MAFPKILTKKVIKPDDIHADVARKLMAKHNITPVQEKEKPPVLFGRDLSIMVGTKDMTRRKKANEFKGFEGLKVTDSELRLIAAKAEKKSKVEMQISFNRIFINYQVFEEYREYLEILSFLKSRNLKGKSLTLIRFYTNDRPSDFIGLKNIGRIEKQFHNPEDISLEREMLPGVKHINAFSINLPRRVF